MSNLDRTQMKVLSVERPAFWRALTSLRVLLKLEKWRAPGLNEVELERQKRKTHALLVEMKMQWRL